MTRCANAPGAGMTAAHPTLFAETFNGDCHSALVDRAALQRAMQAQGDAWYGLVTERCSHLFADTPVFVTSAQLRQMREVIEAVERVVVLSGWLQGAEEIASIANETSPTLVIPAQARIQRGYPMCL